MEHFGLSRRGVLSTLMTALLGFSTAGVVRAQPATSQPASVAYAPPSRSAVLNTTFVSWDSMAVRETATGQSRSVFDNPTPDLEKFEMHITTLKPGLQVHAPHHHPWEEMLVIKEGEVEVSINGKQHRAGAGSLVFWASHDVHGVSNASDKPATYYVINFYTDLVHTTADKPAAEQAVPGKLSSSVIDCNSLPATPTAFGSTTFVIQDTPTLTFPSLGSHITTLNAGQSTRADLVDSGDELFIIKSGLLEATINGVTCRLKEGSFFYCAPNDKRTFKNIGTTTAAYQVIRVVSTKAKRAG